MRLSIPVLNSCTDGIKSSKSSCSLVCFLRSCNGLDPMEHPIAAHSRAVGKAAMPEENERQNISCGKEFLELDERQQSQLNWIISNCQCFLCQRILPHFQLRQSQTAVWTQRRDVRKQPEMPPSLALIWNKNEPWFTILNNCFGYFTFQPQVPRPSKEEEVTFASFHWLRHISQAKEEPASPSPQ